MIKDWIFSDERRICRFRVAGLLLRNNHLLVQKDKSNSYAIPGGHVSFGETSENALIREFREEIGIDIQICRLIWVEENFWKCGKKDAHNISFYYLVTQKDETALSDTFVSLDNNYVTIQWVSFDDLKKIEIYPEYIKYKITSISENIEHFSRGSVSPPVL